MTPLLSPHPLPSPPKVYVAVGIDDERPMVPEEKDLPGAPTGRRLEMFTELMTVGLGSYDLWVQGVGFGGQVLGFGISVRFKEMFTALTPEG